MLQRDDFYNKFPWVFALPERPQCSECWMISSLGVTDGQLQLTEYHTTKCSRFKEHDHEVHVVDRVANG